MIRKYHSIGNGSACQASRTHAYWFAVLSVTEVDFHGARDAMVLDAVEWCGQQMGGQGERWVYNASTDIIQFRDYTDAVAFKLRWC